MPLSRRRFVATLGLSVLAATGCGPSKQDSTPNPALGPPNEERPPKRDAVPETKDPKKKK